MLLIELCLNTSRLGSLAQLYFQSGAILGIDILFILYLNCTIQVLSREIRVFVSFTTSEIFLMCWEESGLTFCLLFEHGL